MVAVTGYIDDLLTPVVRQLAYALGVMHRANPRTVGSVKPQKSCRSNEYLVREVRRDLPSAQWRFAALFMRFLTARFVFYRAGDRFRGQQFALNRS